MADDVPPMSEEGKLEWLKMIQNVIDRMARESANLKNWSAGLVAALVVLARLSHDRWCGVLGLVPVLMLGVLDCYYLGAEREFRRFYARVIQPVPPTPAWTMNPWSEHEKQRSSAWATARDGIRVTTVGFTATLAIVLVIVALLPT